MSAADDLALVLSGQRPAGGLLQTCRMAASDAEFYGEEAILERCRAAPLDLAGWDLVAGQRNVALFGPELAVFADIHEAQIGRIWIVGSGEPAEAEPAVAVPFDPDLRQERGGVFWDEADHPGTEATLVEVLAAAGGRLIETAAVDGGRPAYRVRAYLIRAWGEGDHGAGLFALHRLGPGPTRRSGFGHAAVLIDGGDEQFVRDPAFTASVQHSRL